MKYLIGLGLSLAFVQAATAQDRSGAYIGASLGYFSFEEDDEELDLTLDDTTTAYRLMGGYRFSENFAVEGGWGRTGDVEESFTEVVLPFGTLAIDAAAEFEVLTVRALGFIPFERTSLFGGVGYYDADIDVDASISIGGIPAGSGSDGISENGATLVGGFEFNLERVDIRAELEWFDIDEADAWDASVGVLFHF
ncbi:MAG TPA: outer membrane beta-barrel protein [Gammaproteobacteria bacterium]